MIEQQPEATFAKFIAIAFQVVAAELINHNDDNEFGAAVVGGSHAQTRPDCDDEQADNCVAEEFHCRASLQPVRCPPKIFPITI
jgi:hypothetical protein